MSEVMVVKEGWLHKRGEWGLGLGFGRKNGDWDGDLGGKWGFGGKMEEWDGDWDGDLGGNGGLGLGFGGDLGGQNSGRGLGDLGVSV